MTFNPFARPMPIGDISPDGRTAPYGMQVTRTADPSALVTTSEAKNYLRQKGDYDDTYIGSLITESMDKIQRYLGKAVGAQTLVAWWQWVGEHVDLPYPPQASISEVVTIDSDGDETVVAAADYVVEGEAVKRIVFDSWVGGIVKVTFVTGAVEVKSALLTEIGAQYKNRADADQPGPPIDMKTGLALPTLAMLTSLKEGSL